jgi:hypothetical protein
MSGTAVLTRVTRNPTYKIVQQSHYAVPFFVSITNNYVAHGETKVF